MPPRSLTSRQVWGSLPPDKCQQVVTLWTELLQRQLRPAASAAGPDRRTDRERCPAAEPEAGAASPAPAGDGLRPAINPAPSAREPGEHTAAIPACRAGKAHGMGLAAGAGR